MAGKTREAYGLDFPTDLTPLEIELVCYRDGHEAKNGGLGREGHFKKAAKLLWPHLEWNRWLEMTVAAWCRFDEIGLTGGGAAGKTLNCALCATMDWIADPMHTNVVLTSTTVPALRQRVWGEVTRLWGSVPGLQGNLVESSLRLESYKGSSKGLMRGIAVKDGSVEKAVGNIQGQHNERVIIVIDEMPQTPKAIVTAASNLSKGAAYFRFVGIGNAVSRFDQHGRLCEPIGGWGSVNENMEYWLTQSGICLHFDALQSPNIVDGEPAPMDLLHKSWLGHRAKKELSAKRKRIEELKIDDPELNALVAQTEAVSQSVASPEELHERLMATTDTQAVESAYVKAINKPAKFPYLTTAKQVADEEQRTSRDSMEWWMYVRGFWPPDGILNTVFSQTMLAKLPASTLWREEQESVAGLDPAFGGGDRCVLTFGKLGVFLGNSLPGVFLQDVVEIRPNVRSAEPVHYQIANRVIEECQKRSIQPDCFALDSTGEGGGLADILAKTWSPKIHRVEFGGSASELQISRHDHRKCRDIYSNRVTELWFTARQFAMNGQIAGLDDDTATELISRQFKVVGRAYTVESKLEMKSRTGRSPDCFVAGTLVSTPTGEVPIEKLEPGDWVLTPFGQSRVMAMHAVYADAITSVMASNGVLLEGKGAHRVMTPNGWVRMDSLLLTTSIESIHNRPTWLLLKSLNTRARNLGFKQLVDTIKATTTQGFTESAYFTGRYGSLTMARFLTVTACITSTVIGRITRSRIWKSCSSWITAGITWRHDSSVQNSGKLIDAISTKQSRPQGHGTLLQKGWRGTVRTPKHLGRKEKRRSWFVQDAEPHSNLSRATRGSVQSCVRRDKDRKHTSRISRALAAFAELAFSGTNTEQRKPVVLNVLRYLDGENVKVYNLTLEEENAYYANGFLVENCADSACVLTYLMRLRGILPGSIVRTGLRSTGGDSTWVQKCREHDVYSR